MPGQGTAQDVVGRQEKIAALSVTSEMSVDRLREEVDRTLEQLDGKDGSLFLVDMMGGTPCNTALLKCAKTAGEVVTGVNLNMMISAFSNRTRMDLKALATKVAEDGKRAILLPKELLMKKLS